ncbi:MAG: hypothetical protein BWX80_03006 [Candidatus Hydrogenedentes bacterium ADurb.Bin101]|nr:MAG: hypothetical protein BWX80_03006 [Candidatus Hydrogenedentes bacterium ADurb.Bin101]
MEKRIRPPSKCTTGSRIIPSGDSSRVRTVPPGDNSSTRKAPPPSKLFVLISPVWNMVSVLWWSGLYWRRVTKSSGCAASRGWASNASRRSSSKRLRSPAVTGQVVARRSKAVRRSKNSPPRRYASGNRSERSIMAACRDACASCSDSRASAAMQDRSAIVRLQNIMKMPDRFNHIQYFLLFGFQALAKISYHKKGIRVRCSCLRKIETVPTASYHKALMKR